MRPIVGVGTVARRQPDNVTVGIDTYGSVFKKYKETGKFDEKEIYPYLTEGIGEDILPANVDFSLIDYFVKVTDKDAAIMTRKLSREEGMFVGWSCGSAVYGALEWAREICSKSPTAQRMLKYAFNLIDDGLVGQQIFAGEATRLAYMTEEAREGRDAFVEKRPKDFSKFPWHY